MVARHCWAEASTTLRGLVEWPCLFRVSCIVLLAALLSLRAVDQSILLDGLMQYSALASGSRGEADTTAAAAAAEPEAQSCEV